MTALGKGVGPPWQRPGRGISPTIGGVDRTRYSTANAPIRGPKVRNSNAGGNGHGEGSSGGGGGRGRGQTGGCATNPTFTNVEFLFANGVGTEGGTDGVDSSDNAELITFNSNAQMDTGVTQFGNATLLLAGTDDYIRAPVNVHLALGANDFAFEAWVYPTTADINRAILTQYTATGQNRAWYFLIDSNNFLQTSFFDNGGSGDLCLTMIGGIAISLDVWTYVVVCREGNNWGMYIDGVFDSSLGVISDTCIVTTESAPIRIGAIDSGGIIWEFEGNVGPTRMTIGETIAAGFPSTICVPTIVFPES